jgi:hypothetical protein
MSQTLHHSFVRRAVSLVVLALLVPLAVALGAGSASAYTYSNGGRVGTVSMPAVIGTHQHICNPIYQQIYNASTGTYTTYTYQSCSTSPALYFRRPLVGRSPSSRGNQTVQWSILVQRYDNGWYTHTRRDLNFRIDAGASRVALPDQLIVPSKAYYLRVVMALVWRNASTGRVLAAKRMSFVQQGDYVCQTSFAGCSARTAGWIYIRDPQA